MQIHVTWDEYMPSTQVTGWKKGMYGENCDVKEIKMAENNGKF
jgi:hypothetical protein